MTKTLTIVLNHNLPDYTNWVYYSLKKFMNDSMDLMVMDNGSKPDLIPKYAQIRLKKNIYWGGALNVAFQMVLDNPGYDSLLFLNNDIEFTPDIFFDQLRTSLFKYDLAIATPCIAGKPQPWRQMQNWGHQEPRIVNWIDNQAPMIHRKLIEAIGQFPEALQIGWGQELICSEVCRDRNWKIAVLDYLSIIHYGKQTLLQNKLFVEDENEQQTDQAVSWEAYKAGAMKTRDDYFRANPLKYETIAEQMEYGLKYTCDPVQPTAEQTPSDVKPASRNFWNNLFGRE
jgi:hypothetical protein